MCWDGLEAAYQSFPVSSPSGDAWEHWTKKWSGTRLNPKKATGWNSIPPKALRCGATELATLLTTLFNSCFRECHWQAIGPPIGRKEGRRQFLTTTTPSTRRIIDYWRGALDNGDWVVGLLSTDMSKALDCLHYLLLLAKLRGYGFHESSINLMQANFTDRYNRVRVRDITSQRSRRSEVVGERESGRARGRHARGEGARFFLCPPLPSASYAG